MGKEGKGEALHRGCYHCDRFVADRLCCSNNSAPTSTYAPAYLYPARHLYTAASAQRDTHTDSYARTNLDARANA